MPIDNEVERGIDGKLYQVSIDYCSDDLDKMIPPLFPAKPVIVDGVVWPNWYSYVKSREDNDNAKD